MEEQQKSLCRWEPLSGGARVLVSREHGFGTDAVLLADFSRPNPGNPGWIWARAAGSFPCCGGCAPRWGKSPGWRSGSRPRNRPNARWRKTALPGRSPSFTGMPGNSAPLLPPVPWTALPAIPPYTATGAGIPSPSDARRTARQGDSFTLEDLAQTAKYALRFGGRLCVCLRPNRLGRSSGGVPPGRFGAQTAAAGPAEDEKKPRSCF